MNTIPSCTNCGQCCRNQAAPPFVPTWRTPEDDSSFEPFGEAKDLGCPQHLIDEIMAYLDGDDYDDSDPCLWLDPVTKSCKHYEYRPSICRDYPLAGPSCHAERVAVGLSVEGWPVVPDEVIGDTE